MNKKKTLEELNKQEVLAMLTICILSAQEAGDNNTWLDGISLDSFRLVLNEAKRIINKAKL